jgi:hypothetical protein
MAALFSQAASCLSIALDNEIIVGSFGVLRDFLSVFYCGFLKRQNSNVDRLEPHIGPRPVTARRGRSCKTTGTLRTLRGE